MYKKMSAKNLYIFSVGAILFGAVMAQLAIQLYIHITSATFPPKEEIMSDPVLPIQFILLSPLAGIVLGCIFGAIWAWILMRLLKKEPSQQFNSLAPYIWLGVLLISPIVVHVFLSRVWAWAADIIPQGISIVLVVLWGSALCCYGIWVLQRCSSTRNATKIVQPSKFKKNLPLILLILLLCSVFLGMIVQIYPISASFVYLLQGSDLFHLFSEDLDAVTRMNAIVNLPAGVHPAVVAVLAFLLSAWGMNRKLETVKL